MSYGWKDINTVIISFNIITQVSTFGRTHALGCGWLHRQWRSAPCNTRRSASAASVRQFYAPANNELAGRRHPVSCSKVNWSLGCLVVTDVVEWKRCSLLEKSSSVARPLCKGADNFQTCLHKAIRYFKNYLTGTINGSNRQGSKICYNGCM